MAHAGGRPTDYRKEYCPMLIEHMTRGLSFSSFGAIVGVAESTLHLWKQKHPEFSEAEYIGRTKSMYFWEELGITGIPEGHNFNDRAWSFNMKNRFGWRDKHDLTSDGEKLELVFHESLKQEETDS